MKRDKHCDKLFSSQRFFALRCTRTTYFHVLQKMTDSWWWVRCVWEGSVIEDKECLWMCGLLFHKLKMCILLRHMQNNKCFLSTLPIKAAGREKSRFITICRAMYMTCEEFEHVTVTCRRSPFSPVTQMKVSADTDCRMLKDRALSVRPLSQLFTSARRFHLSHGYKYKEEFQNQEMVLLSFCIYSRGRPAQSVKITHFLFSLP